MRFGAAIDWLESEMFREKFKIAEEKKKIPDTVLLKHCMYLLPFLNLIK